MSRFTLHAITALLLALFLVPAPAQSVKPVARLDLNQYIGTWYVIERYPIKRQRTCIGNEMVLYSLNDKLNSLQFVTACALKDDNTTSWNASGRQNKYGDGRIRLSWIWPFTKKYWVLALDPDYKWALVGAPNRNSLWIVSRTATLAPDALSQMEAQATAKGFNTNKLVKIPQH